jgi:hypothetical protein
MQNAYKNLQRKINEVRRRWIRLIIFKGLAQSLLVVVVSFITIFVLDMLLNLPDWSRFLLLLSMVLIFVVVTFTKVVRPILAIPAEIQLARYLEEKHPDLEDRLVTAVELGGKQTTPYSDVFLHRLLDDARTHIAPLNLPRSLPARAPVVWSSFATATLVVLVGFLFANLDFFSFRTNRIVTHLHCWYSRVMPVCLSALRWISLLRLPDLSLRV